MVISVTNGLTFYDTFHSIKNKPLVLAYPSNNSDILLTWSDKLQWKDWMIRNKFGPYVAKPIDLAAPTFPFILKETVSEGSKGVFVVKDQQELQSKLAYFKDNNISRYFGEEALTGMGNTQGIFYVSAFEGKVLSLQCYVFIIRPRDIAKQNFSNSIFIAGRPLNKPPVFGYINRVKYDLGVSNTIRKITRKSIFSGVYCAEFKMNRFHQIIFLEFNARICAMLTKKDAYFVEAYLPLAFAIHRRIRSIKSPSPGILHMIERSRGWYQNQTLQDLARNSHLHSRGSFQLHAQLKTISEIILRSSKPDLSL